MNYKNLLKDIRNKKVDPTKIDKKSILSKFRKGPHKLMENEPQSFNSENKNT